MSVKAINTYTATVTPQLAEAWLAFNYAHQRPVSQAHIAKLAEAMRRETFTTNTIKFAMYSDNRCMVNGQHTLRAIVASGKSIILPVQDFVVDGEPDIQSLYYHEDTNRKRTFADSVRVLDFVKETGLSNDQIVKGASALKWMKCSFGVDRVAYDSITQDDLLELVPLWKWEIKAIYSAITPCSKEIRQVILKQPVFSVALVTMRYAPREAREFWRQVAQDDGLEKHDPRKSIAQWLSKNLPRRGRFIASAQEPYVASRAIAIAWNTWCAGRELKALFVRDTMKPMELKKCGPYNGSQSGGFASIAPTPNEHLSAEFGIE